MFESNFDLVGGKLVVGFQTFKFQHFLSFTLHHKYPLIHPVQKVFSCSYDDDPYILHEKVSRLILTERNKLLILCVIQLADILPYQ